MFSYNNTYPACDIQEIDKDNKITPYYQSLFDFKEKNDIFTMEEQIHLTSSLDNLIRLGILIKNRNIIELNYDYEEFKNYFMYKAYLQVKNDPENTFKIIRARIELTDFGRKFTACCIEK